MLAYILTDNTVGKIVGPIIGVAIAFLMVGVALLPRWISRRRSQCSGS